MSPLPRNLQPFSITIHINTNSSPWLLHFLSGLISCQPLPVPYAKEEIICTSFPKLALWCLCFYFQVVTYIVFMTRNLLCHQSTRWDNSSFKFQILYFFINISTYFQQGMSFHLFKLKNTCFSHYLLYLCNCLEVKYTK